MFNKSQVAKSDEKLMEGIQNGNESDFEVLYHRYAKRMLSYFYNLLNKDRDKAQDFLQELFIKLLDKAHQFDTDKNFVAWMFTLASNMCKNEYRKITFQRTINNSHDIKNGYINQTESDLHSIEFQQSLLRAVDRLGPEKKELYILRFEEELSIEQIALVLDIRAGTVKSRLFHLKRDLARQLKIFDPKMN